MKYYLTHWDDIKLHQKSSSVHLTTKACESCHSHMSKYFYHPHLDINLFILKLKEYQNVIYLQLRRVNLHTTVTSEWSHVAKGDACITQYESEEISKFYRWTVHIEIYVVHSPTNALFINLVKNFKFTLKYTIISFLHVSVFNDYHEGTLSVPN